MGYGSRAVGNMSIGSRRIHMTNPRSRALTWDLILSEGDQGGNKGRSLAMMMMILKKRKHVPSLLQDTTTTTLTTILDAVGMLILAVFILD